MSITTITPATEYPEAFPTGPNPALLQRVLGRIEEDLVTAHPELEETLVRDTVRTVIAEYEAEARLHHFLPALTEGESRRRLTDLSALEQLAA